MEYEALQVAVSILHYMNTEDTRECVQSFVQDLDTQSYHKQRKSIAHANRKSREKTIFVTKNAIKAIGAYLELLEEYEETC